MFDWLSAHFQVVVFLTIYFILLAKHAIEGEKETGNVADYYIGSRSIGGWAIGMSFFATFCSTNTFIGLAGQSYSYGLYWLPVTFVLSGFSLIAWLCIAPRFREFTEACRSITIADFIGSRYNSSAAQVWTAILVVPASVIYMIAIYKGIGNLIQIILHISYTASVMLVFVVTVAYTAAGGFRSVVKTDVTQGLIMLCSAAILFAGAVFAVGGPVASIEMLPRLHDRAMTFTGGEAPIALIIGVMIAGSLKLLIEPRQLARFYAIRDKRAIRTGMWVSTICFLALFSLLAPLGLLAWEVLPDVIADTDLAIPAVIDSGIYPPIIVSFISVAIIAAAMSSLDSVLLVVGSMLHRDIGSRILVSTQKNSMVATRIYIVLVALITAVISLEPPGSIISLTALSGSIYAACLGPAVLFGLFWKRGNGLAVFASSLTGLLVLILWPMSSLRGIMYEVFPAIISSTFVFWCVSKLTRANCSAELESLVDGNGLNLRHAGAYRHPVE